MCTRVHAKSFIKKMTDAVKKKIGHCPEVVGELYFKNYLPPMLCHLDHKVTDGRAVINDGIGKTLMFVLKRYDSTDDGKIEKLLDRVFDHNMTPAYVASVLIATTQAVIPNFAFAGPDGQIFCLPEPYPRDFGDKKIFFLLLVAIIDLFINMLIGNGGYAGDYARREEEWIDYVNFILVPDSETRH